MEGQTAISYQLVKDAQVSIDLFDLLGQKVRVLIPRGEHAAPRCFLVRIVWTCAVGDDIVDVPVLRAVGLAVAVADACAEAKADAHYVTQTAGGRGAVREVIELILRAQGTWQAIVARYRQD